MIEPDFRQLSESIPLRHKLTKLMICFCIYINEDNSINFSSFAPDPKFELLTYTFIDVLTGKNLENWYNEFLEIYEGKAIMQESWGVRSWSPTGDIWITIRRVTYDLEENGVKYHLEIPASRYKKLVEDWMKFVKINSKTFSN